MKCIRSAALHILSLFLFFSFSCLPALNAQAPKDLYFTPKVGYSLFTGIIGLEVQYKHFAFDIGYIPSGGVRYYFRPNGHSWFAGLYGSGYGLDHAEAKDGIAYTHYSQIGGGMGGGYRWFWRSRWHLELGASVGYNKRTWSNERVEYWEKSILFSPILTAGVSF